MGNCCACFPVENEDAPNFRMQLVPPEAVSKLFYEIAGTKGHMTPNDLEHFLSTVQGEAGVTVSERKAAGLIRRFGTFQKLSRFPSHEEGDVPAPDPTADGLSLNNFFNFLLDPAGNRAVEESKEVFQDMNKPLWQYFIATSYNTFLSGNQLTSTSSAAAVKDALLRGVRVVDLDLWEADGTIVVRNGQSLTSPASFEECLRAVQSSAFKASFFPVILNLENNLPNNLHGKAAQLMAEVLGPMLFVPPMSGLPPSAITPDKLRGKVAICDRLPAPPPPSPEGRQSAPAGPSTSPVPEYSSLILLHSDPRGLEAVAGGAKGSKATAPPSSGIRVVTITEKKLKKLSGADPRAVVGCATSALVRAVPESLRVDSSNADPMLAWTHGVQMAALNLQYPGPALRTAAAFFATNGGCGYVRKPDFLLSANFNPQAAHPPRMLLEVEVIMSTRHRDDKTPAYVKLETMGLQVDRASAQTKVAENVNQPQWHDEKHSFRLAGPEIAMLSLELYESEAGIDDLLGYALLPVNYIRLGCRVVPLVNADGQPSGLKLLCTFNVKTGRELDR